jgi:hypothetical protein
MMCVRSSNSGRGIVKEGKVHDGLKCPQEVEVEEKEKEK